MDRENSFGTVLVLLNLRLYLSVHSLTLLMVAWILLSAVAVLSSDGQTVMSSPCRVLETCFGTAVTSFMFKRKSVGEMVSPGGTPSLIHTRLLRVPSSFTLAVRWKKSISQLYMFP